MTLEPVVTVHPTAEAAAAADVGVYLKLTPDDRLAVATTCARAYLWLRNEPVSRLRPVPRLLERPAR